MNFLQCLDRFAVLWILLTYYIQCMILLHVDLPHFGHWSRQYSCANSLNIFILTLCVWISTRSQDKDIFGYGTLNRSQDTDICVLVDTGQITGQIAG